MPVAMCGAMSRRSGDPRIAAQADAQGGVQDDAGRDGAAATVDFRSLAAALEHFHVQWRRLGPLEHTVPRKSREALAERMSAAVQRLEGPLQEARRIARTEREALVARALALGAEAATPGPVRHLMDDVRALQAEWQRHAKSLPLARGDEAALWSQFKGAIDAVFSARDAARDAHDAQLREHAAERTAWIERLEGLADATPAVLKRTLIEAETAWQRCGPAPRAQAAALDGRFRRACDAARQWLQRSEQRGWHDICDALSAKLELCDSLQRDDAAPEAKAGLEPRWLALPILPAPWEAALRQRAGLSESDPAVAAQDDAACIDDSLLQLELALNLPSPPECEGARRELKLHAMKAALEGRRSGQPPAMPPEHWFVRVLCSPARDAQQRQRLAAIVATLRERGPAGLEPRVR